MMAGQLAMKRSKLMPPLCVKLTATPLRIRMMAFLVAKRLPISPTSSQHCWHLKALQSKSPLRRRHSVTNCRRMSLIRQLQQPGSYKHRGLPVILKKSHIPQHMLSDTDKTTLIRIALGTHVSAVPICRFTGCSTGLTEWCVYHRLPSRRHCR